MSVIKKVRYLPNELEFIRQYVKNMDVLDIGAVAHYSEMSKRSDWLHGNIKKISNYVVGVDIAQKEVDYLREKGYNIIYGNAETVDLDRTFDVVMVGDTLAQLSNQGIFLDNMYKHLENDGKLIITTPSMLCWWVLKNMFLRQSGFIDAEHLISLHDVNTLSHILSRHNFEIEEIYYYDSNKHFFCKYIPILSDTIIIIAKKRT